MREPTSEQANPLKVFLCHSSADKPAVRKLYEQLSADGFRPWLDEIDILPGQDWDREITRAVRASDVVLVCISANVLRAGYLQKEIKYALDVADQQPEGTIYLIPVKLEESQVPERLRTWQWVNLFETRGYDKLVQALRKRGASISKPSAKKEKRAFPQRVEPAPEVPAPPTKRTTREPPEQPGSIIVYVLLAFVSGLISGGLLVFYVYEVPKLIEAGVQNQIFYLLLIPWGLTSASFLFGVMRSYARFSHKKSRSVLELGGPVVLFCLVVGGGVKLIPAVQETFDLTVRARSADDSEPIITRGKITIDLGSDRRSAFIGPNGEADFKGIPPKFKSSMLLVLPQIDGYEEEWQVHKLQGNVLELSLARAQPLSILTGSIVPPPGKGTDIQILIDGQKGETSPDQFGRFELKVQGKTGDRVRLKIFRDGELVYDDFQVIPGPVTLKLQGAGEGSTGKPHAPQADVFVTEQKEIPSTRNTKFALRVTIQASKTIQPVHLRVRCDGPLLDVDLQEPQRLVQYSHGVIPNETNVAEVTFVFPPIDSNRPVVIVLFSNEHIRVSDVRNIY